MSNVLRLTPLALAIALVAGCATPPKEPPAKPLTEKHRFSGGTLADLETRQIIVEAEEIAPQSAEEVLNNYQTALALFRDPAARLDTMRRMAELTMEASQTREVDGDAPSASSTTVTPGESEEVLYQRFMQGMTNTRDMVPRKAAPAAIPNVNYAEAVKLYEQVVRDSQPGPAQANAYYELAKAYDLNGQRAESVDMLRKLFMEYPGSVYATEAQFRVAEYEFSTNRFAAAADNYAAVMKSEDNKEFRDQALYKQAWSLYKASDYEAAQPLFFQVIEEWQARIAGGEKAPENILSILDDTYNIISLGFIQQDGPRSVDAYFKKTGAKDYEADVYMNLGQTYLSKRLYRNAAETFDYFVAKYPFDARAPEFSSATIRAYQDGGFPSEVIPAKENFVKRYGPASEFWAKANDRTRDDLLPLLQSHIIDLAKHQHAVAQQSKKEEDYLKAASWYRQHLALKPAEAEAITINQLLAEALFAARKFDDAIIEFEKTAYSYPSNPKPEEAAYFALVAYLEQDPAKMSDEARKSWWERRVASTHRYAEKFPADKNTPKVLQGLTNDQIAAKDVPGAMKTAGIILQLQPAAPDAVVKEAWMVIGDGEFDLNRPEAAEFAYNKVLAYNDLTPEQRKTYQGRLTASVYKQAEKLRDSKDVDGAVAAYLRAASVSPDPKLKAGAEFDAATMYLNAERYAEAIPMLVAFRNSYPGNELNDTIPEKLALAYEKTDQLDRAAAEYEGISARNLKTEPELARQALWTAAEMYEKAKRGEESARVYRQYITSFPKPIDSNMEAQFRLYNHHVAAGNTTESQNMLRELSRSFDRAGADNTARTSYLGAMAKFRLNQPIYDEFAAIQLRQPLKKSLAAKRAAMQKALDAYSRVASIGVAEFTTASNYQIAEIYRKLAADLMASERPKGLSELELEQYGILLEEQATPFEDKALELYVANAELVKQNVYDDYVRQSFEALAKLSPGRYNKREQSETYVDVIY
ncbi:MAG: tetratricopeptide repeat protein [Moraxellaceae bacterium]